MAAGTLVHTELADGRVTSRVESTTPAEASRLAPNWRAPGKVIKIAANPVTRMPNTSVLASTRACDFATSSPIGPLNRRLSNERAIAALPAEGLEQLRTGPTEAAQPTRLWLIGHLPIVRQCVRHGKRVLFPSTSEVYGMCRDSEFDPLASELVYGPIEKQRWIYACSKQLMDRIIYASMTGANAAANRQAVLSNNLANVSTNGFRAELATYRAVPLRGDGFVRRVRRGLELLPQHHERSHVVLGKGVDSGRHVGKPERTPQADRELAIHPGTGRRVECSLLETAIGFSSWTSAQWLADREEPTRRCAIAAWCKTRATRNWARCRMKSAKRWTAPWPAPPSACRWTTCAARR